MYGWPRANSDMLIPVIYTSFKTEGATAYMLAISHKYYGVPDFYKDTFVVTGSPKLKSAARLINRAIP